MKITIKNKNEVMQNLERAEILFKELREIFAWNIDIEVEIDNELSAETDGTYV